MSQPSKRYKWPVLVWRDDGVERQIVAQDFELEIDGLHLRVPAGYDEFDGATIPRWLWNSIGHPFTREFQRAALIHDYLYGNPEARTRPEIDDRAKADALFYRILLVDGVERSKAKTMHWAVDGFGAGHYRQHGFISHTLAQFEEHERRNRERAESEAKAILSRTSEDPELRRGLAQIDWAHVKARLKV